MGDDDDELPKYIAKPMMGEESVYSVIDGEHGIDDGDEVEESDQFRPVNYAKRLKGSKDKVIASKPTIQWFRLQCPGWSVITKQEDSGDPDRVQFRAEIYDVRGTLRASATKSWSKKKSGSGEFALECAETGAINRACNNLGFLSTSAKQGFDPDGKPPFWEQKNRRELAQEEKTAIAAEGGILLEKEN